MFSTFDEQQALYKQSIADPTSFWTEQARLIDWIKPFTKVQAGSLSEGNVTWFDDGELNVCYNCVDRHYAATPDKIAIIWEQDEPSKAVRISYRELYEQVCRLSNVLKKLGVKKGDIVAVYMPMIPQAVYAMLACARIGAVHSVVFAGFSAEALSDRINDAKCKVLLTADQGRRGGKLVQLKKIADEAVSKCSTIEHVLVYEHTAGQVNWNSRDLKWEAEILEQEPSCPFETMKSEDPLFLLYTSGSTGKPKGLVHSSGGYLIGVLTTLKYTFNLDKDDIWACVADVGWITGHSYICYGPLSLGLTSVLFESLPTYPTASRYWQMVDEHQISHFYTAPTAIRALKRLGDEHVQKCKLTSLKVLGTVGEPINPEAWQWYSDVVGKGKCAVVDTYWQTETGSFILAPYAAVTKTKPGSATFAQFGIKPAVLNAHTGEELQGNDVSGVLCLSQPWPSMARTVFGDHQRFKDTYLTQYKGYYFTGDGVHRDSDGYYWIKGRVDDVINVSGHRLSTAEIEAALIMNAACAEAAVVGVPDELTGQSILCFVSLKPSYRKSPELIKELTANVRQHIGPFATPKRIVIVDDLPKTRSGKIMRRILRKLACGEQDSLGDLSTLADPMVIEQLVKALSE